MKEQLIEKFSLKPTNHYAGAMLVNNIIPYLFKDDVYFFCSNMNGEPLLPGMVTLFYPGRKGNRFSMVVTESFLLDISTDSFEWMINEKAGSKTD